MDLVQEEIKCDVDVVIEYEFLSL